VQDDLEELFPIHGERGAALEPSRQAQAMLAAMARGRERLRSAGVHFGRARLAVRAEARAGRPGCAYCARCLVGCPYGLIWDSTAVLDALAARPGFRYAGGLVAERVRELPGEAALDVRGTDGAAREPLRAERVFLACGVVSTTRLLLASLDAFDRPARMLDSQYFLLPLLHLRGAGDPQREALHTLAQLFIEIRDPRVSARNVHLQVYSYNDMYRDLLERLAGPLRRVLGAPTRALLSRLSIVQGYLHSDDSRAIRVTLRRGEAAPRLVLEAESNPATRRTLHRVVAKLARHARDLGALPLWPLLQVAPPGRGFHSGGTFPMRATPGPFQSDVLGRPHGFERVHAVDSSVLPSIPSTTITFSVMANAHRIGSATARS
jgi:choline dehydrogenase-like flavoprotein